MNAKAPRKNIFFNTESTAVTIACYILLAVSVTLIALGPALVSTIWMWSWPCAVVLVALSAWKKLWALTAMGVLILLFPMGVILFQGF
ncbi:hypothetical protein P4N68_05280 [Corynebacterium felinum]|uniref:Uncharacterized protein n=1 Tax=Corynebacterium felinum TaxID=131318 RepID=A0ABU2B826_9CORY|nr:hypothetical protein [Corynebacterium felinum]MDF5820492.1 hypothetical protein [Corynebacterium felinum]MDR7354772.1 hypothetical protein [Corynebacterium felinum]WJY94134.1 hypothetical protein CFELI_02460 [Corynebacterium felinum]